MKELTNLRIQECKKLPNTFSVYMVRLDPSTDALMNIFQTDFKNHVTPFFL